MECKHFYRLHRFAKQGDNVLGNIRPLTPNYFLVIYASCKVDTLTHSCVTSIFHFFQTLDIRISTLFSTYLLEYT